MPFVSVIIPCYNEEKNLKKGVLEEVRQYLEDQTYLWEVIIVNDESTDDSKHLIEQFILDKPAFSLFEIPHGGKPAAVWAGIGKARGEIVLFIDMDQSTPINEVDRLLPWYEQGFDVVIGSRGSVRSGYSLLRKAGSFVFLNFRRLFLLHNIRDTQCGFKSARRQAALDIFPRLQFFENTEKPTGWKVTAYDVELLYLFERAGYRTKEVDVHWFNRDESDTKGKKGELARYVHESVDMVKEIINIKLRQYRGGYKR
jgi:glycosyltransferase involved in cell wall biosynthesis